MSDRQAELEARRNALIKQTAQQRDQLKVMAAEIKERLARLDRGIAVARSIARKPTVIAGAIAVVSLVGPRRILRAVGQSAMFIATGRRLIGMFRGKRDAVALNAPQTSRFETRDPRLGRTGPPL